MTAAAPTYALLHGFTGAPASWDAVCAELSDAVAIRPALLGHAAFGDERWSPVPGTRPGETASSEAEGAPAGGVAETSLGEVTARTFDEEVDRLAAQLAPHAPVHLAGYSLGGRVALGILARHPELVARATLIGAHPGLEDEAARRERREADARWIALLETEGLEGFTARWEALPLFASQRELPAGVQTRRRRTRLAHDPRGLAASLRVLGLGAMPPRWATLDALPVPVTWVTGERDLKFRALAERAVKRAPRARLVLVPGAGHDVVLERPDAVAAILQEELP